MTDLFIPGHTIGIVGGGHQGRLLALAAKNLGLKVGILDPDKYCPAADMSDWHVLADLTDEAGLIGLAEKSDLLTFTCQSVNLEVLEKLKGAIAIPQNLELLELAQNRWLTKKYFEDLNINIVPYQLVGESADLDLAIDTIGLPAVLKPTKQVAGKKQSFIVETMSDVRHSVELLGAGPCLLESYIDYERAIAVSVVGNGSGHFEVLPIVDIVADFSGSSHRSIVPAAITFDVANEIERLAGDIALSFNVRGLLTIEMFVTKLGIIYVNSLNHGPHDAGDYTLNVGPYSQYEAHLRGLFSWPVSAFQLTNRCLSLPIKKHQLTKCLTRIPFEKDWYYHFDRPTTRKDEDVIGHVNIVTDDLTVALNAVAQTEIWEETFPFIGGK